MAINVLKRKILIPHVETKFRRINIEGCVRLSKNNCSDNICRRMTKVILNETCFIENIELASEDRK